MTLVFFELALVRLLGLWTSFNSFKPQTLPCSSLSNRVLMLSAKIFNLEDICSESFLTTFSMLTTMLSMSSILFYIAFIIYYIALFLASKGGILFIRFLTSSLLLITSKSLSRCWSRVLSRLVVFLSWSNYFLMSYIILRLLLHSTDIPFHQTQITNDSLQIPLFFIALVMN